MSENHNNSHLGESAIAPEGRELTSSFSSKELRGHVESLNISNRTLAGVELRTSEDRYRRLFEAAKDGILILEADTGLIIDANPFLVHLLGYTRSQFVGKALWDIGLFRDREASKAAFRELQDNEYVRYDNLPLKTSDGRPITVEFVSNVYEANDQKVIQCNIRDITQRRAAEKNEQRVQEAQKMEAVGQLAGGIAHDFNNLLGVVLGYCELVLLQTDLSEVTRTRVVEIQGAGTFAKNLTQRLLAFSHRQVSRPIFLNLNDTVSRVDSMLDRLLGDDVELVSMLEQDLGTIKADNTQLEQVLMNLAINARDAMPQGGRITIETANIEVDETYAWQHPSATPGPYVRLTVSDTGVGMDASIQSRIFEPFFSTKEVGKGTGLGLATVFGIVKQSGGTIEVYSEPGHGTAFKVYFPRCYAAPVVLQHDKTEPLRGGTETILLVDDSAPLRRLTRLVLEGCGYNVLDSGDPREALRIAGQHSGMIPLMITDVVMPGFSGPVLADKIAETRPEMRVLFTSGYAADEIAKRRALADGCAFLEKPFTRTSLMRKVRELLDSSLDCVV